MPPYDVDGNYVDPKENIFINGVKWDGLQSVTLADESDKNYPTESAWCEFIPNMSFICHLKTPKYSRKKYKKYLMSLRCSRNFAEKQCDLVASYKGAISYNMMLFCSVLNCLGKE